MNPNNFLTRPVRFPSEKVDKKQRRKRPSAVPADDDDSWLEDDMGTRRAPGQPRRSKFPRDVSPDEPKGELPSRVKPANVSRNILPTQHQLAKREP
ncbi:unnamed protein product [Dibothriocephalus latus]|uniref:Uncharacterized protein n=1 Tax=Dibothriocephalus latus TaxID=60516 RepID=A0A3P7N7U3_DIBLA|nr:unnamed protein product [Dibothriocephalus latus]